MSCLRIWGGTLVVLTSALCASASVAQNLGGILGDIIGGAMAHAQAEAARQAWGRVPGNDRFCLGRAVAARRADLSTVIAHGVFPEDPRLASFFVQCRKFNEAVFRHNYTCSVKDKSGELSLRRAAKDSAIADPTGKIKSCPSDVIELHFSGQAVSLIDVETNDGRLDRSNKQEAARRTEQVAALRCRLPHTSVRRCRSCAPKLQNSSRELSGSFRQVPPRPRLNSCRVRRSAWRNWLNLRPTALLPWSDLLH